MFLYLWSDGVLGHLTPQQEYCLWRGLITTWRCAVQFSSVCSSKQRTVLPVQHITSYLQSSALWAHNNTLHKTEMNPMTVKLCAMQFSVSGAAWGEADDILVSQGVGVSVPTIHNLYASLNPHLSISLYSTDYFHPPVFLFAINLVWTKASLPFNIVVRILPRMTLSCLKQPAKSAHPATPTLDQVVLGSGSIRQEPNTLLRAT